MCTIRHCIYRCHALALKYYMYTYLPLLKGVGGWMIHVRISAWPTPHQVFHDDTTWWEIHLIMFYLLWRIQAWNRRRSYTWFPTSPDRIVLSKSNFQASKSNYPDLGPSLLATLTPMLNSPWLELCSMAFPLLNPCLMPEVEAGELEGH